MGSSATSGAASDRLIASEAVLGALSAAFGAGVTMRSAITSCTGSSDSFSGSTTAIRPFPADSRIISVSGLMLNMTATVTAAAAAMLTAVRLHQSTTVLRRAALSRPSETPSQTRAGTSSCPSSRIDLIIWSNSFIFLFSSNIFNLLYLVLQPDPCPAQLCP